MLYTTLSGGNDAVPFAKASPDPTKSERQLKRWNQCNATLNNASVGRRRGQIMDIASGHSRRLTAQERRYSESILPRLMDGRVNANTTGTGAGLQGYHAARQVTAYQSGDSCDR